ncbi:MAG TPA: OsmC family protein [Spongiibacteraceae bacterium]|jgi:putative redox protein
MTIRVTRDQSGLMKHRISIREHTLIADVDAPTGGEDAGPSPHDLYDSALGACKALTLLWYAKRKQIPVEDIQVIVERDDAEEKNGTYRLKTLISITGDVSDTQRKELLSVAAKCPLHKLMTQITTEIETDWL